MNNPQLKGMDLVRWLDNKLGNPNELWCGRQASSVLSREILNELSTCFQALEPHVKLKIIEAIPHLSPKIIQMWRDPLTNLLNIAKDDADNWIRTVAKLYIHYPSTGAIKCDISDLDKQFGDIANDFQKILDTTVPTLDCNVIPPDSLIVTPAATQMAFGYSSSDPKRNFTLRKPLKSEQMLQDAMRLAQSTHNPIKRSAPGVTSSSLPIRVRSTIRKPDNTLPMRGISIPVSRISSGFSNEPRKFQRNVTKREGGALLIDISDLPEAPTLKKRRGPAVPKTPKADGDPNKEPKKRGGGRKPKNQEPQPSNELEKTVSLDDQMNNEAGQSEENVTEEPYTRTTPIIGTRKLDNMIDGGAFSFI